MRHQGGESFELVIVAAPHEQAPPVIRLRHVLKALLRTYGFRCARCRDVTPYPAATPTAAQGERGGGEAGDPAAAGPGSS